MKNFILSKAISANQLIADGVKVEFDKANSQMKLIVSDKQLIKYECDLLEKDYPKEFPYTTSILEIHLKKAIHSLEAYFDNFSTEQSDELIFVYFEQEVLGSMQIELIERALFTI